MAFQGISTSSIASSISTGIDELDSFLDSNIDSATSGLESLDSMMDKYIPEKFLPADIRRYLSEGSDLLNSASRIKDQVFNSYLYHIRDLSDLFVDQVAPGLSPHKKSKSYFDDWQTAQQNFWEVRFIDPKSVADGKILPSYFAVLPAIDCSMDMASAEVNQIQTLSKKIYTPSSGGGGSDFSLTFLDDETLSIQKFLRAWIKSTEPRPGVMMPLANCALDVEFRKYTRTGKLVYERKVAIIPDGKVTLNLNAASDEDIQTPAAFIIVGEE